MTRLARGALHTLILARDLLLTAPLVLVLLPIWWLPWRAALELSTWYAWIAALCWPSARRTARLNLRRAYGDALDPPAERRIVWRTFGQMGLSIAEGLQFTRRFKNGADGWNHLYTCDDPALEAVTLEAPHAQILVTGHLGSWEVLFQMLSLRFGNRGGVIVRRVDNPFLNGLMRRTRLASESQWIEKRGAMMESLARLRRGDSVAMLLDENGGRRGVFVDFFGRPASTSRAAALLSLASGAPVIVAALVRQSGPVPFRLRLCRIVKPADGTEPERAVYELTEAITGCLERWIRESPEQWRWFHWRWRTRPDSSEETYSRADLAAARHAPSTTALSRPS
jgi:Kdo2-lipid IVA lauroyltransferase/acyltransferase